jgi:hypothetical protein
VYRWVRNASKTADPPTPPSGGDDEIGDDADEDPEQGPGDTPQHVDQMSPMMRGWLLVREHMHAPDLLGGFRLLDLGLPGRCEGHETPPLVSIVSL